MKGKREVMITGYCIQPNGKVYDKKGKVDELKGKMLDYAACLYPEGVLSSERTIAFNHENIDKIIFKGYETDKQKQLSTSLNKLVEKEEGQE